MSSQSKQKSCEKLRFLAGKSLLATPLVRFLLVVFGWLNVALAIIGIVIPGFPTTIFLIIALWAFSQSSKRLHYWLFNHRMFGPLLHSWKEHGVIPVKAKRGATLVMLASWLMLVLVTENWLIWASVGIVMLCVAVFIVTRPSMPGRKPPSNIC